MKFMEYVSILLQSTNIHVVRNLLPSCLHVHDQISGGLHIRAFCGHRVEIEALYFQLIEKHSSLTDIHQ